MAGNIKNIAEMCGVTTATVSMALRDHTRISARRREEIQKVAKALGYHPNIAARDLRTGKTNSIGILWSLDAEVVRNLTLGLMNKGYISYLTDSLSDIGIINTALQDYINRNIAGLIIQNSGKLFSSPKTIEFIRQIPVVIIINENANELSLPEHLNCTVINRNHCRPWEEIIKHFKSTGRKRIALVGQQLEITRENAYLRYLELSGFPTAGSRILSGEYNSHLVLSSEVEAKLLNKRLKYDAILTTNDELAAAIIGLFLKHGVKVPQQIAVAGFNDEKMSKLFIPPLASVDRREQELTEMLLKDLFERLENPDLPQRIETLDMSFICRESAG